MDNLERASTIDELMPSIRNVLGVDENEPNQQNMQDILTNLMHWCDRENVNFSFLVRLARDHYVAELNGE